MRFLSVCVSATLLMSLMGCGQSGALQLRNDPNHDGRAKYLLYSDSSSKSTGQKTSQPESTPTLSTQE